MRIDRADRSRFSQWWFTVDHQILMAVMFLIGAGLVLSFAASPAVALKKGLPAFYFAERHAVFAGLSVFVVVALSFMPAPTVRRIALIVLGCALVAMILVQFSGDQIKGARRWLEFRGVSLQPSEFAKPAFVVISAWLFAQARKRPDMPALFIAVGLLVLFAGLLMMQPDVGQTMLIAAVWGALYFLSGQPLVGAILFGGAVVAMLGFAYAVFPHVQSRIDAFLAPSPTANSQMDRAMQSFTEGGFLGRGPGEGTIKSVMPDAHSDFILAVVAEEYGAVACLVLLGLIAFIVLRSVIKAVQEPDDSIRLGIQGLALVFGLQAMINMGVNTGVLPAKGMTLPFISAGGSSMLGIAITVGMLLALRRGAAGPHRFKRPRLVSAMDGVEV